MKHTPKRHRIAIAALSAAILLPIAPVFGQDAPAASPPPVVTVAPPPPVFVAPPPPVAVAPPPVARPAPPPVAAARPAARTTRTATRARVAAPVRRTAPAPAPAPVAAPVAVAPVAPIAPVAELPAPIPAEPVAVPVETQAAAGNAMLPWFIGGALLIAALAFFMLRRRRATADEVYEEPAIATAGQAVVETPAMVADREAEEAGVEEAGQADFAALAEDSEPVAGRPWLEFLMRPVRAGTSSDDAIVQFELTVGNTGNMPAKDVKISTWMFAAGQGSEMERSLIEPPPGATVSEVDIAAGDGARVDGEFALPKSGLHEPVLPVVVADARYRLPDGSEGRTSASFAIGMAEGEELVPFPIDRASGLFEDVEARLHGEPHRS